MTFRTDIAALDHKYRAKRSGMSAIEYASSVQVFRRPRKHWLAYVVTAALVAGSIFMARV